MKLSFTAPLLYLALSTVNGTPTPTIDKRASISDACNVGYCTQNGGTKGGAGGATTTVSSLAQLSAAASGTASAVIVVKGAISGAAQVRVGSNKSIIGASGSCMTRTV
jgi:pectate lyase